MNHLKWKCQGEGVWALFHNKEYASVFVLRRDCRYYVVVSQPIPGKHKCQQSHTVGRCRTLAGAKAFAAGLRFAPNRPVMQRSGCVANHG